MSMTAESVCDTTARPRAWLRPGLLFSVFAILPVAPPSAAIGIDIDQAADAPPEAVTPAVTPGRTLQPLEPGRRGTYTYVRARTRGEHELSARSRRIGVSAALRRWSPSSAAS